MTSPSGAAISRRSVHLELAAGVLISVILLGGLGGWAATTHLDGAIVARGQLAVSGNVKQIQHRDGGIVERILVRDGMRVEAGWLQSQALRFRAEPDYPDDDYQRLPTQVAPLGGFDPSGLTVRIAVVGRF